jgi:hypothetical protein
MMFTRIIQPSRLKAVLILTILSASLAACGGGSSSTNNSKGTIGSFSLAQATPGAQPKQIELNWSFEGSKPSYFTVEVNPDGSSGFEQADLNNDGVIDSQDQIPSDQSSIVITLPLHLLSNFNNGLYYIAAHNEEGNEITKSSSIDLLSVTANQLIGYIKASNTGANDAFGNSVVLSADGNTLAVSAAGESSNAKGIAGNQNNNSADGAGAVYVFIRNPTTNAWTQQAYVKASNAEADDSFGASVALSGDGNTLAVGANGEGSDAKGTNGDQDNNSASRAGAVYIFNRNGSSWSQQAYVKASNTEERDFFGSSVALSADGNTLAVGASGEDGNFLNFGGADNSKPQSGAVYTFTRIGSVWSQQAYLKASNTQSGSYFGFNLALAANGTTLAIGASGESSFATGIGGDEDNTGAVSSGAVYVFTFNSNTWSQQAYIKASNTEAGDGFGNDLALASDGNTLAVSARSEDSNAIGINGDENNNSLTNSGAVYVYSRDQVSQVWSSQAYIKASNPAEDDGYGISIALSADGNVLAVSSIYEAGSATGINGNQSDNSTVRAGAAYVYSRSGSTWSQQSYIKASNTDANDLFGNSLSLSADGSILAIGASGESSHSVGVDADKTDNSANGAGAVYLY